MYPTSLKRWIQSNRRVIERVDKVYGVVCLSLPVILLASVITAYTLGSLPGTMRVVQSYAASTSYALASRPHMAIRFENKKTGEVFTHDSFSGLDVVLPIGTYKMETTWRYSVNSKQHIIVAVQEYEVRE